MVYIQHIVLFLFCKTLCLKDVFGSEFYSFSNETYQNDLLSSQVNEVDLSSILPKQDKSFILVTYMNNDVDIRPADTKIVVNHIS